MERNKIKIVANQEAGTVAYYFRNENGEWIRVSSASLLSKRGFRYTTMKEKAREILAAINEEYNYGERGIDILFEGADEEFLTLCTVITNHFSGENMICRASRLKIAVAGKVGAGKRILVEELSWLNNIQFQQKEESGYTVFQDKMGAVEWYVLEGIEIGKENVAQTQAALDKLALEGISVFIYCVASSKIETLEEELVIHMRDTYGSVRPLVLLTQGIDMDAVRYADVLSERLGGVKVMPILARDKKTRGGVVPAFGLKEASKYIFEGI